MKKIIPAFVTALFVCTLCVLTLTACNLDNLRIEGEGSWDTVADTKKDCLDYLNAYFDETLKDPNVTIVYKSNNVVQFTENIKGTDSSYVGKDGTTVYAYKKGEAYYYAVKRSDTRYYYTTDETKPGYNEDAKDFYDQNYAYFLNDIKLFDMISEEDGAFSFSNHVEDKDVISNGKQVTTDSISTMTFAITTENGTISVAGTAKMDLVQTISIVVTSGTHPESNRNITMTFSYGSATFTAPDTDAWDQEAAAAEARTEANLAAIDARNEFFEETLCADNYIVTETSDGQTVFTETIVNGIDCVDYGTYKVYTYAKDNADDTDYYYVFESDEEKYYVINDDSYDDNCFVWYNMRIVVYDDLADSADFMCEVENGVMTFEVKNEGTTIATVVATKTESLVTSVTVTVAGTNGDVTSTDTIAYGAASLQELDLTDFVDRSQN